MDDARLYGLKRDELRYVLDPQEGYGSEFPGETFRVLTKSSSVGGMEKEMKAYGEFRTKGRELMLHKRLSLCSILIVLPLALAACKPAGAPLTSATRAVAQTIVPVAHPSPIPTWALVLDGTPFPSPSEPITAATASRVAELARRSKGTLAQISLSPDGHLLAVVTSIGIYLIDAQTQAQVRLIETGLAHP